MKLVEILARELKEWPDGVEYAWQDTDKEVRFNNPRCDFYSEKMCSDYYVIAGNEENPESGVTREMWEQERAKSAQWKNGFPPVGEECEFSSEGHHSKPEYQWCIFHGLLSCGGYIIEFHHHTAPDRVTCDAFDPSTTKFRPIRTPEQIAEEERNKVLNDMYRIITTVEREGNRSDMVEALYDEGYRKKGESQ